MNPKVNKLSFKVRGLPLTKSNRKDPYHPERVALYRAHIAEAFARAADKRGFRRQGSAHAVRLTLVFTFEERGKKGAPMLGKPDADNLAAVIMNCLNGFAYVDDRQVAELSVRKQYGASSSASVKIEGMPANVTSFRRPEAQRGGVNANARHRVGRAAIPTPPHAVLRY
jgi:Holliday junction resolvase RusA-like endonuclease